MLDYTKLTKEIAREISKLEHLGNIDLARKIAEKYPQLKIKKRDVKFSLGYILKRESYFILKDENSLYK